MNSYKPTPHQIAIGRRNVEIARSFPIITATAETFSDKLRRAVRARQASATTRKQHEEQAAKERSRYHPFKRRKPTPGE
jgi:hypothetical protein